MLHVMRMDDETFNDDEQEEISVKMYLKDNMIFDESIIIKIGQQYEENLFVNTINSCCCVTEYIAS